MFVKDNLIGHDLDSQFNSNGHRCKELEALKQNNYLLFAGDNLCLGLDKPIEETFPYIVSNRLKIDYYNLAVFNGGYEALKFNVLSWIYTYNKQLPKYIILCNEFINSVLVSDQNFADLKAADYDNPVVKELIDFANVNGFFSARNHLLQNLLSEIISVPIIQINLLNTLRLIESPNVINIDVDSMSHDQIATLIVKEISDKKRKVAP